MSAWTFAAVALVITAVCAAGYRAVRASIAANESVAHTFEVMVALERVLTVVVDAETGVRGYTTTGERRFLEPYEAARADENAALDEVAELTADNPSQRRSVDDLRREVDGTFGVLQRILAIRHPHDAVPLTLFDRQKMTVDAVRLTLQRMRVEEQQLLTQRNATAQREAARAEALIAGMFAATVLVIAVSFVFVDRRAVEARLITTRLEELVRDRTAALQEALEKEQSARRDAQRANQLKDQFLMTVSHELRTPLNAMAGWARMLLTGGLRQDTRHRAYEALSRGVEAQTQIVNHLLDATQALTGSLELHTRPLQLAPVARRAVQSVQRAAEAKGITIEVVADDAITVVGDPDRLQQVIWNLLSNAVKFTPPGGSVRMEVTRTSDDDATIVVTDSGDGIPADFLPFVFDRFRQADASTTRSQGGLGLGLAVARTLVELHGGSIEAGSDGTGRGATFRVRLPAA